MPSEVMYQVLGVRMLSMSGLPWPFRRRMRLARISPAALPPSLPLPWAGPATWVRISPKSLMNRWFLAMPMNFRFSVRKRRISATRTFRSSGMDSPVKSPAVSRTNRSTSSVISTRGMSFFSVAMAR